MARQIVTVFAAVLLAGAVWSADAVAAPCARACKDEVAACRQSECASVPRAARRKCRHNCQRSIVHDCFNDLSVCGATSARPVPSNPSPPPSGGW